MVISTFKHTMFAHWKNVKGSFLGGFPVKKAGHFRKYLACYHIKNLRILFFCNLSIIEITGCAKDIDVNNRTFIIRVYPSDCGKIGCDKVTTDERNSRVFYRMNKWSFHKL